MKWPHQNGPSAFKNYCIIAVALMLGLTQTSVWALGTASGTDISNLAKLAYTVGGVAQGDICSSSLAAGNLISNVGTGGTSTCTSGTNGALNTTFKVDNKVNVVVAEGNATFTSVVPGQAAAVTTFTVTNLGNTVQDYRLTGTGIVASGQTIFTFTDNFDPTTACITRVESGATVGYQAGADTGTFVDELAADGVATVYVVCDIPAAQINNDLAITQLTAITATGGTAGGAVGADSAQSVVADTAGVDIVFADAATVANVSGTIPAQTARDGMAFARDAFRVQSAVISVAKTVTLLCDPFNGSTNPKNIPGAIERWTLVISNAATAGASASLAQLTDALSANTTYDANLVTGVGPPATAATTCSSATGTAENAANKGFKVSSSFVAPSTGRPAASYPKFLTGAADADGATQAAGTVTLDYSQSLPAEAAYTAGEIKPGDTVTVYFNVTVN